ncbi:MAG: ISKra4 family transposase [Verrucomicrobia bacterium]|nr:ISKra4 family transposase [Verrucomicrobiota bacterium]
MRQRWVQQGVQNTAPVEVGLREALFKDAAHLLEQLYNDPTLPVPEDAPRPGEKCHARRVKEMLTLFGWVKLGRNYYYDPRTDQGRAPLDEALGLVESYSPAVVRLADRAAARLGYEAAQADLKDLAGLQLEGRQIQRLVGVSAPALAQILARPAVAPAGPPIPVFYVEADGTGVPMRPEELVGRPGKQPDGSAKTREVKVGCVFTQTKLDEQGRPMRDYQSTTYVTSFAGAVEFGGQLRQEALRRGLGRAQKVLFLGDGAPWVWEVQRVNFPDAVAVLDRYHALEHLQDLCLGLYGEGSPWVARLKERWVALWDQDQVEAMIAAARARLASLGSRATNSLGTQIDYFQKNKDRMRYGTYRKLGYFYGSGVVEAACKTIVGARFKQSGMLWGQPGAQNVLALRCALLSHRWEQCWSEIHGDNYLDRAAA